MTTSSDLGAGAGRGTASAKASSGSASDRLRHELDFAAALKLSRMSVDVDLLLSAEAQITRLEGELERQVRVGDLIVSRKDLVAMMIAKNDVEDQAARLSALLDQAREVVSWALPFANQALEEHRVERLRCGHGDIGAERGTDIGLWDSEVETRDAARAFLTRLSKTGGEGEEGVSPSRTSPSSPDSRRPEALSDLEGER